MLNDDLSLCTTRQPVPQAEEQIEASADDTSVLGLADLLLKDPARVDWLVRDERRQLVLVPPLLAIGLISFSLFALALVVTLNTAPPDALPQFMGERWALHRGGASLALWLAYALGFTLTTGVCLPSFYFYGLLAGVRLTWTQVTTLMIKGQATTAIVLMGIMPVYLAAALGGIVFGAPPEFLAVVVDVGLGLPFVAGLWGVRAIYRGFLGLSDTLPAHRRYHRECWLRRLTGACSACYTAVCPVMILTLWRYVADQLATTGL